MSSDRETPTEFPQSLHACTIHSDDAYISPYLYSHLLALQSSGDFEQESITSDDVLVLVDSGCSIAASPDLEDFDPGSYVPAENVQLKGITSGLSVHGIGYVTWTFDDTNNVPVPIRLRCIHVPGLPYRLFPPQQITALDEQGKKTNTTMIGNESANMLYNDHIIVFPYDSRSRLPMKKTSSGASRFQVYCGVLEQLDGNTTLSCTDHFRQSFESFVASRAHLTDHDPDDDPKQVDDTIETEPVSIPTKALSSTQERLLRVHYRLGHIGFNRIQKWVRQGLYNLDPSLAKCKAPMCPACQYGAAKKRPHAGRTGGLLDKATAPGKFVSVDQLEAGTPGLMPFQTGKPSDQRYKCCTIWVDHFSKFIFAHMQKGTTGTETIESKTAFESFAKKFNVLIEHIHSDNGIFSRKQFAEHIEACGQLHTLCGVSAHWQNGVVERYIGILTTRARTALLHAISMWPSEITPEFWSFAFKLAVRIHNLTPDPLTGKTPYELFTGEVPSHHLNDFRVFGCPVYVLEKNLADDNGFPKWKSRSHLGIYVGHSEQHSSNVIMVWNPVTKHVSPQYHVVLDEGFETIRPSDSALNDTTKVDAVLQNLFPSGEWIHTDEFDDPMSLNSQSRHYYFDTEWDLESHSRMTKKSLIPAEQIVQKRSQHEGALSQKRRPSKRKLDPLASSSSEGANADQRKRRCKQRQSNVHNQQSSEHEGASDYIPFRNSIGYGLVHSSLKETTTPKSKDPPQLPAIVSQFAHCSNPSGISDSLSAMLAMTLSSHSLQHSTDKSLIDIFDPANSQQAIYVAMQSIIEKRLCDLDGTAWDGLDGILNDLDPFAFAAAADNSSDTLTQSQMLKADDRNEFVKAQVPEIEGLVEAGVFEYHFMSELPKNARLLNAIWSYRRKRRPDGSLLKYKSRICVDGSQQQYGIDYWETYAPVCQWSTIRLLMILSAMLGLKSRQVDYTQAFPQADLDDPVYMRIPQGWQYDPSLRKLVQFEDPAFRDPTSYIQLKKNLYGCKQAARNWYLHLKHGLLGRSFRQSVTDPCLFIREDCVIVLYTDDCCIFAHSDAVIDALTADLQRDFLLKDEGDINDYLGVRVTRHVDTSTQQVTSIILTQTGLIDNILTDVGLVGTRVNTVSTPADQVLQPSPDASPYPPKAPNYRSIIGKLNFLAQSTRPDIAYAVHCCARFMSCANSTHYVAAKRICRYLYGTRDKGLILTPKFENRLSAYVDSDFAGSWSRDTAHLRQSALSRAGFVITYAGCPIHWISKLESEIALSTCEAEYIALSMCARQLIPLRRILDELSKWFTVPSHLKETAHAHILTKQMQSVIHEDNAACLSLANDTSATTGPRTRHLTIKWHHFKDQIANGSMTVVKVDTSLNWADIFTKPLARSSFESLRKLMMGW